MITYLISDHQNLIFFIHFLFHSEPRLPQGHSARSVHGERRGILRRLAWLQQTGRCHRLDQQQPEDGAVGPFGEDLRLPGRDDHAHAATRCVCGHLLLA